jgi:UDP-glucose 4-epimerase
VAGRRILITGVSNFWGARLAARLAGDPGVARVTGVDTRPPGPALAGRIEFLEADLLDASLGPLVRAAAPDVVVHNDIVQFAEPGRSAGRLHDFNVIGTLQLLTACDGLPALKAVVVRGSAAIYGSEASAPAFFTEAMAGRYPLRTRFQRDVGELESLVEAFARRHPRVTCTMLRLQPVVGPGLDTPVTRLMRLPVVPTVLGFDPRIQLLDAEDAVAALHRAALHPVGGAVNVSAPDVVSLSRALRRFGRPAVPIAHPLYEPLVSATRRLSGLRGATPDIVRYLRYGRGVDTTRMRDELGFAPRLSTLQAIERVLGDGVPQEAAA